MKGLYTISLEYETVISEPDSDGNELNDEYSEQMGKYTVNALRRGWKMWDGEDGYIYTEAKEMDVKTFLLIASYNGRVDGFDPNIRVEENCIDDAVPEGLPNRTYLNGSGDEVVYTWMGWNDGMSIPEVKTETVTDANGVQTTKTYYVLSGLPFDAYLTTEVLLIINETIGVKLIDRA